MTLHFDLVSTGPDNQSVTALIDGEIYVATNEHPNWQQIVQKLVVHDVTAAELFNIAKMVQRRFEPLGSRVTVSDGKVFYDGDEINNSLTEMIMRFLNDGIDDWQPLVKFFEKVMLNPNDHSREQLYSWLVGRNITIDTDGDIIAYKGVKVIDEKYFSINAGKAIVDGVEVEGYIPNAKGSVITMPRSEVEHNPSVGCHKGIHAGTWDYASGFAQGAVLTVKIDPRDVVSVPSDCSAQKMRTCRIRIIDITDSPITNAVASFEDYEDEYDEDEYNEYNWTWDF